MAIVVSRFGVAIALIEVGFIICKYLKETTRKRRSEIIERYNKIFNDTYTLVDKFKELTKKTLFYSEDIRNNLHIQVSNEAFNTFRELNKRIRIRSI